MAASALKSAPTAIPKSLCARAKQTFPLRKGSTHLQQGQDAIIRGTSTDAQYKTSDAPPKDEWDRWNNDRDHTIQSAQSWSHTDRYYTGSEDLDAYGHWGNIPDYGPVWYPSVSVGWTPYRAGRWV